MPDALIIIISTVIPSSVFVLLTGNRGVAVVHIDDGIFRIGEGLDFYPGDQRSGTGGEFFYLVIEFGKAVTAGEDNIIAVTLGFGEGRVGEGDQDGEIYLISGDLGVVDGEFLAKAPVIIPPGSLGFFRPVEESVGNKWQDDGNDGNDYN